MLVKEKPYTSAEFWDFVNLPENRGKFFERHRGEVVAVSPSNIFSSGIASRIIAIIDTFIEEKGMGMVTGEQGGYEIGAENVFAPDVAYITEAQLAQAPRSGFAPFAPDLAVEVISPSDSASDVQFKVAAYLSHGTRLVWVVYPDLRMVVVHTASGGRTFGVEDTLDGGDVLPGFSLPVKRIFSVLP
jgi:Uma2 family endonuclease